MIRELHDRDVFRQQAISRLLDFEETYVKNMQIAIQRYCRPLKKGAIISSSEYASLFQNVEKLLTISEYYVRQLKLNSLPYIDTDRQGEGFIDAVGFIYMAKLQLMCEMYGIYCAHLDKAKTALYSLVAKVEFRKFLEEAIQTDPSIVLGIEDFICKPYQHIWQVLIHLQSIQVYTATDHHDYPFLEEVVLELHRCCNSANSYRPHTIQYSPPSSHSTMVSRSTTSSSLSTVSSGDSEMVQLRNKTIFAKHVKEIPLCVPNRHLIYAGKLNQVTTIQKTRQTWVMLFSDIILITDKQENVTVVIEDPIYIHDLVHQDYDRSNVNEFQLICRLTGISYQSIVLEAPSVEQKHTWKTLLQQRIDNLRDNDNSSLKHQSSLRSLIV
ncbi:neuroepithelial cell-transforming gene 1 protein-like [Tubulanus polymorphus]|uniref:neuroepithelial cell-transforming gene 1 protein-like n=1 Tax=Tubulanus polymorphus TaxID=672921 RepID=UPI003DA29345